MSALPWLLFALLAAGLVGYAVWTYRTRELPIRGRGLLAALRAATLVLLLLLLWNPSVPGTPAFGSGPDWTLLDASASMATPVAGRVPWDSARAVVGRRASGSVLATFGGDVRAGEGDGHVPAAPGEGRSVLAPALARAAEAGARRVTVVSDMRVEDPVAVRAALARLGVEVRWVDVGGDVRDAGVEALEVPEALGAAEGFTAEVVAWAAGARPGDSLAIEVLEEGRTVATRTVPAPADGRRARVALELPAPAGEGSVRYEARVTMAGDARPDDDGAAGYVAVAPTEGALVLVSLTPDWEPRFLLPVLAGVTGLRPRGFLRAGPGRFLPVDGGEGDGPTDEDAVAREAAGAELLVLHGVGAGAPAWVRDAAASVPRVILLPTAPAATSLAGVRVGAPRDGEWYVASDLPSSPLAGELASAPFATLPPLGPVLPAAEAAPGEVVFRLQLRGSGPPVPGLVLTRREGGRTATALAAGTWRWAFRPGDARETYRRLWSGVAGWLLAERALARGPGVAPTTRVVAPGEAPAWTSGAAGGDVTLRVTRGDSVVLDTTLAVPATGAFRTPPLPPGTYGYEASAGEAPSSGRFDVAADAELAHPRMALPARGPAAGAALAGAPVRRPVRTHPLPWLLALALLAAEWTLRRRRGLR